MKKYIKPAIVTVKIDNQEILAGSIEKNNGGIDGGDVGAKGGMWSDED